MDGLTARAHDLTAHANGLEIQADGYTAHDNSSTCQSRGAAVIFSTLLYAPIRSYRQRQLLCGPRHGGPSGIVQSNQLTPAQRQFKPGAWDL